MKRVRVRWHTTEVIDWEGVVEIPDDADPDDLYDGNAPELIKFEDDQDLYGGEFIRSVEEVTLL